MPKHKAPQFIKQPELRFKAAAHSSREAGLFPQSRSGHGARGCYPCSPTTASPAAGIATSPGEQQHPPQGLPPSRTAGPPSGPQAPHHCTGSPAHIPHTSAQPCQGVKGLFGIMWCHLAPQIKTKASTLFSYYALKTWDLNTIFFSPTYWHCIYLLFACRAPPHIPKSSTQHPDAALEPARGSQTKHPDPPHKGTAPGPLWRRDPDKSPKLAST